MTWLKQMGVFSLLSMIIIFLLVEPMVTEIPDCEDTSWCPPSEYRRALAGKAEQNLDTAMAEFCLSEALTAARSNREDWLGGAKISCNRDKRPIPDDPCSLTAWKLWLPESSPSRKGAMAEAMFSIHCPTARTEQP